jgi:Peptidase inhibitor I9
MEDMLRTAGLVALSLLVLSCNGESPTEPFSLSADAAPAARRRGSLTRQREMPAPCAAPARLSLSSCPAGGYIVVFRDGTNVPARVEELSQRFGFRPRFVYSVIPGFAALLSVETMTAIRCEPDVAYIEEDALVSIGPVQPCAQ